MTPPIAEPLNELVQIDLAPRRPTQAGVAEGACAGGETFHNLKKLARELKLHTVCESAQLPQPGRVLEPEVGHLHDAGQPMHAALRLLRGAKGKPSRSTWTSRGVWPTRWRSLGWRMR